MKWLIFVALVVMAILSTPVFSFQGVGKPTEQESPETLGVRPQFFEDERETEIFSYPAETKEISKKVKEEKHKNMEGILPIAILCLAFGLLGFAFVVCIVGIVWVCFSTYFELLGPKKRATVPDFFNNPITPASFQPQAYFFTPYYKCTTIVVRL